MGKLDQPPKHAEVLRRQHAHLQQRTVPKPFRSVIKTDWHRKFTWRERLAILFGFNFYVYVRMVTQHKPGECQPIIVGDVSKHTKPDEAIRERLENLMDEQNKSVDSSR